MAVSEHDLDHHRLKVQVEALQALVLKLYVELAAHRAPAIADAAEIRALSRRLLRESVHSFREPPSSAELAEVGLEAQPPEDVPAFAGVHREVFTDLERTLEFILDKQM